MISSSLTLALGLYWPAVFLAAALGVLLLLWPLVRPKRGGSGAGWWWRLPAAFVLLVGPYVLDVARTRAASGESWGSAMMPTTVLLMLMQPDNRWPYGTVFDRLHKAPPRHALWAWQRDKLAAWCGRCVASNDRAMALRGTQIAATLAGRGSDEAVTVLIDALRHADAAIATLAADTLSSLAAAAVDHHLARITEAAKTSPHAEIRRRLSGANR